MIGVIMATMLEADPFISLLALQERETGPFRLYGNERMRLIISGIGKTNAAMASTYLIRTFEPKCLCNLGAAGATDSQCLPGECYHISRVMEPDRPDLKTGIPCRHLPDMLDSFPAAILATQDRPIRRSSERRRIAPYAQLVDMEGAAIVQTCRCFHVKCYLFKFVSDTPDHHMSSDIIRNIELYRDSFAWYFSNSVLPAIYSSVHNP
ncbi:MAG: hypothetical protein NTX75_00610 [Proteobacteria bacterium]|nr:hypothetical protein [Pseudomonadota bacterium]